MAHIENIADTGEDLRGALAGMDEPELLAQQITQQGALHALTTLLAHGCTEQTAEDMLASLRSNMLVIEAVARDKGFKQLFIEAGGTHDCALTARSFRLLTQADVIREGDECLSADAVTWVPIADVDVGTDWHHALKPMRRRTAGAPASAGRMSANEFLRDALVTLDAARPIAERTRAHLAHGSPPVGVDPLAAESPRWEDRNVFGTLGEMHFMDAELEYQSWLDLLDAWAPGGIDASVFIVTGDLDADSAQLPQRTEAPLNGIAANWFHGEGAIAQCGYCRRYSLNIMTLGTDAEQPMCECGQKRGWSGSFKKPGLDAEWSGKSPDHAPAPPEHQQNGGA